MNKAALFGSGLAVLLIAALSAATPAAAQASAPLSTAALVTAETLPPIGWVQFCGDQPQECGVAVLAPKLVKLDDRRWKQLVRINRDVNDEIEPMSDLEHWGTLEKWSFPVDGKGDCEDYVLEKRKRLIDAGWPRQALLITVVRDKKGDGHAVLTVKTDRGDLVLDNQESRIKGWTETGYRFVKRQSEAHPSKWVSLSGVDQSIMTANR
ncbi:MAG: transglutaminase-like cysteine peptidase [Methylocystis sp.]|jgi:predicted transglutaminase-like cysteine proteinase|nr:transglutaminase-like cysteine peptidase [Methylocystis sp.]MCA3586132.1 transglutaminase-like cysteine peptidase [Methylocystis sp.]MCA3589003.1 transglutaminase-like cysteine peptidase [Methylocystis sp.]MCA3592726.1 transglutaminase-like cysteine peptidase [Methylocystis sp.]